jgi:hypothetical protein
VVQQQSYSFPHNAKGIDHERFWVSFTDGKIMASLKDQKDIHYTLMLNGRSGIIDVHITSLDEQGERSDKTLFAMKKTDLESCLQEIGMFALPTLGELLRPLRLGWLAHRNIGVIMGLFPTDQEIMAATVKKKGKLRFVENALESNIHAPEFLEEIWDVQDRVFSLFASKRGASKLFGIGFKFTDSKGNACTAWIKKRDIPTALGRIEAHAREIVNRYAILPDEYSQYRILSL